LKTNLKTNEADWPSRSKSALLLIFCSKGKALAVRSGVPRAGWRRRAVNAALFFFRKKEEKERLFQRHLMLLHLDRPVKAPSEDEDAAEMPMIGISIDIKSMSRAAQRCAAELAEEQSRDLVVANTYIQRNSIHTIQPTAIA